MQTQTARRTKLKTEQLKQAYRLMYQARRIDDREITMKRQNKVFFQISGAGHEAPQVAAGMVLKAGYDWFYPYSRDRALCLTLGVTPYEMFLASVGAEDDPASGGRQMPSHWGHKDYNIVTSSSPTGTQFLQAVGCVEAGLFIDQHRGELKLPFEKDEVALVCTGDGTTSQGEFWEALNTSCSNKFPVIFLVEDNGYAISVPVEVQTAGGSISRLVKDWPDLHHEEVDGCNFVECHQAFERAAAHCRARQGPALIHAHVVRPYSHSMSDDESMYRPEKERQQDEERDPITTMAAWLVKEKHATEKELEQLRAEVDQQVKAAAEQAEVRPQPDVAKVYAHVYSSEFDPTDRKLATQPDFDGTATTMVDLINACLRDEMARDPRIRVFGEDVADATRVEVLGECKGKGGVFKVTHGLQTRYGADRVFNSPLAEANIVGRAIGMATRGLKPVAEIQFFDYIWPAMEQLRNELATVRWRSHGAFKCPAVIRVPIGGYLRGGGPYHSQSGEVLFTHTPGVHVVMPSNAEDANGLLRTALRCDDPVMFLEHKHLYRQTHNKGRYPGPDYCIPFGQANKVREGDALTVITYGALVHRSLVAAKELSSKHGVEVEILDLRSLSPYDWEAIAESVQRTNKALVAHEDCLSWGYGAEIAARISDELFEYLDGPVRRVGATDTFVGYAPQLEEVTLPTPVSLAEAMLKLVRY
ncbi:MAG: thiamine pyrophosphate-dependent enzyme [Vulcanimicrobiota bacterium]